MFNCVVQSLCELLVEICSVFLSVLCQNSQLVLLSVFVFVKIVLHPFECAVYVICPLYNVFKHINIQSHKIEYLLCVFCPRSLSSYIVVYCCLCTAFLSQYSKVYILASKSLTILSLLSTAFFVVDDVSTLSNSESLGSDPVAVCKKKTFATESDQVDVFV